MKKPRKARRIARRTFRRLVTDGFVYPDGTPTIVLSNSRIVGGQCLATAEQIGANLRAAGFTSYPPVEWLVILKPG